MRSLPVALAALALAAAPAARAATIQVSPGDGQTRTTDGTQQIVRASFNALTLAEICPGVAGNAGLDMLGLARL